MPIPRRADHLLPWWLGQHSPAGWAEPGPRGPGSASEQIPPFPLSLNTLLSDDCEPGNLRSFLPWYCFSYKAVCMPWER